MHTNNDRTTGGIPALRGFRKQFLHTLRRIITSDTEVFYPETLEDFAVYDRDGYLVEVVQVKDHKAPLTLSEIRTLLQRAAAVLEDNPKIRVVLASYGMLGPELDKYIGADEEILKKIPKYNHPDILAVIPRLSYLPLKEEDEFSVINNVLDDSPMIVGNRHVAFDLMMQDLYRGAEKRKAYTRQTLQEDLQRVGQYLVERESHHREWGTTILPLEGDQKEPNELLREGFYEGIAADWDHILADLDIVRDRQLEALADAFGQSKIVIVHGASGQGKSALAYRYLHDYCPLACRYEIRDLSTPKRALEVATALAGYKIPLTFYVDAGHNDKGLPEFLRRISKLEHVSCLVTIREEDWRLTGLTSADFHFHDLELNFDQKEAQELFMAWENERGCHFPDFEQAWAQFTEEGPLLEFVYLLTHSEKLHHRLQQQYDRIVDEIDCQQRSRTDLKLIEFVAIAGASGARIDLSKISGHTTLTRSIARLEKEYLLRLSSDARHLVGLHPIRSNILTSIITDPVIKPWSTLAMECLPLLENADLEVFLLHAFLAHPEASESLLAYLKDAEFQSWTAVGGVMRALQWLGAREYVSQNRELIKQVYEKFGSGWNFILDFDFLGLLEANSENPAGILDFFSKQNREQAEKWKNFQTPKSQVFARHDDWLQKITLPPLPFEGQERDWSEFGQTVYWIGVRKIDKQFSEYLDETVISQIAETLPLENLAIVIYGLWHAFSNTDSFVSWYREIRPLLADRYRRETNTPFLEQKDDIIRAHFIVPLNDDQTKQEDFSGDGEARNRFHVMALQHVNLLALLFPDCNRYGCQGYCHQLLDIEFPDDTTKTNMAAWHLTPSWVVQVNKTARILGDHLFRPATWKEYSRQLFEIRNNIIRCFDEVHKGLVRHFRSKKTVQELIQIPSTDLWKQCSKQLNNIPKLPLEALDYWGYTEETQESNSPKNPSTQKKQLIISGYLLRYRTYLKKKGDYFRGIGNFLNQSPDFLIAYSHLGKAKNNQQCARFKEEIQRLNLHIDNPSLSTYNLAESLKNQSDFQQLFRKHFSSFFCEEELTRLEQQEIQTLRSLWSLWFIFIATPKRRMNTPSKTALALLDNKKLSFRNNLEKVLQRASTDELRFRIISGDNTDFDGKPALWITVDGDNLLEVHSQLEPLFVLIQKSLGDVNIHSFGHYALEFQWQHFVIVPLGRGKLLENVAWVLPVYQFVSELNQTNGPSKNNILLRPIEPEILRRLGLEHWNHELFKDAKLFYQNAVTMTFHLKHLVQIDNLPDLDETGKEIIQAYVDLFIKGLSDQLQQVFDKSLALSTLSDEVINNDRTTANEYLFSAKNQLDAIFDILKPEGLKDGKAVMSMESMKEWQKQLIDIQGELAAIYLFWCSYLINVRA